MVKEVQLFGILKEQYGSPVFVEVENLPISAGELISVFRKQFSEVHDLPFLIAKNHFMIQETVLIESQDQIALLPPVSGG
ncbi:MAG: MoaD/ThiS family protein [Sediminibacterium sp.]